MSPPAESAEKDTSTSKRRLARACGARVTGGRYCKRAAGLGTDHPGVGLCAKHGGNSDHNLKRAGMVMAHEGIMNPDIHPGDVVEIEPHNALLWAVMIGGGDVSYWQQQLAEAGRELETAEMDEESDDADDRIALAKARLKECFREMRTASREMRSAGKMAIDAGLAERQVLMAERMAAILAQFANSVFSQLDLSARDMKRLPDIVQSAILELEAPEGNHAAKPKMALVAHKKRDIFNEDEDDEEAA